MSIYSVQDPWDNYRITHHVTDIDKGIRYFAQLYPGHELAKITREQDDQGTKVTIHLVPSRNNNTGTEFHEDYYFQEVVPIV